MTDKPWRVVFEGGPMDGDGKVHFAVASLVSQGNAEEDARLIQAVPELLVALEALVIAGDAGLMAEWYAARELAEAAIRMARGEQ